MRMSRLRVIDIGLLALMGWGIAQPSKVMFPLLPCYENSINFKSKVSTYSISNLPSLYFLPSIQESYISGWKRVGICAAEVGMGGAISMEILLFSSLLLGGKSLEEAKGNFILYYIVGNITLTNSSIYLTGKTLGLRKNSFIKTTIGTTIGSVLGAYGILKISKSLEKGRYCSSEMTRFWYASLLLPVIGGVIGSNL